MTEVSHDGQQTNLVATPRLIIQSTMPSFHPPSRDRPFIAKQLSNTDNDDADSIYKDALVIEIFQHWKAKALEHQNSVNNAENIAKSNHFTQALKSNTSLTQSQNTQKIIQENTSNDTTNESLTIADAQKSAVTIKKRATPLPPSRTRRRVPTKKNLTAPNEVVNPNLLSPHTKNKHGNVNSSTLSANAAKKPPKPSTIFIEPKKTQPSMPPRSFGSFGFDESRPIKPKPSLEKLNLADSDQPSQLVPPTWAPSSRTVSARPYFYSQTNSIYDDETSSDESTHESLLIRNKKYEKTTKDNQEKPELYDISNLIIPTAICITDPDGNSRKLDLNDDFANEYICMGRIIDNDCMITRKDLSNVNAASFSCSSSTAVKASPAERISHEKPALHSIGEDDEYIGAAAKYEGHKSVLSKEIDRTAVPPRLKKAKSNTNQPEDNNTRLSRRWSDGSVSDEDTESSRLQQRGLVKISSAQSILKPTMSPTSKVSIGKYLHSHTNLNVPQSPTKEPKETVHTSRQSAPNATVPTEIVLTNRQSSASASVPTETVHTSRQNLAKASRPAEVVHTSRQNLAKASRPTEVVHTSRQNLANATVPTEIVHSSRQNLANAVVPTEIVEPEPLQEPANEAETVVTETTESDHQIETEITQEIIENHATTTDRDHANSKREKLKVTSQSSLNSGLSEAKSGFDLDISGAIELKLAYNINKGVLDVYIKRCTDLAHLKRNQLPNPYCKLYLLPDQSKSGKRKTAVKKETTDPVFDETFRYPIDSDSFNTRTLWVSVWSQTSLGHNHFLGEIHIPLIRCTLDKFEEYTLSSKTSKDNIPQINEQTANSNQITFSLTFLPNANNPGVGILQVDGIQAKNITFGKPNSNIICKGLIMPGTLKRKLAIERKGQSPKWDIPIRWENVSRNNLKNISVEISLWREERFRKVMMCFVRLCSTRIQSEEKHARSFDSTQAEKNAWELFLQNPAQMHHIQLPLRPATNEH